MKNCSLSSGSSKFLRSISHYNVVSKVQGFLVTSFANISCPCHIPGKWFSEHFICSSSFGSIWRKLIAKDDYYLRHKGCVKTFLIKERVLGFFFQRNLKGTFMVPPLLYRRAFWMDSALSKNLFLVLYCRTYYRKGTGCVQ